MGQYVGEVVAEVLVTGGVLLGLKRFSNLTMRSRIRRDAITLTRLSAAALPHAE